jgi:hypothetical protein
MPALKQLASLCVVALALSACAKPYVKATEPAPTIRADADQRDAFSCAPTEAAFDCDRRAILAMAGDYSVRFTFDEVSSLRRDYALMKRQRTGGEEFVEVIADTGRFISLQHVLVTKDGMVTKHWRQDWTYEPTVSWTYAGARTWQRRTFTAEESRGAWLQTVWQVDDSPRYAGVGRWTYDGNVAVWTSDATWRPLPRREHTIRKDYDVMVAINRHEITPFGWTHLQDNLKLDTKAPAATKYLARESGVNRYDRISGFPFGPGHAYWTKTGAYWAHVRSAWEALFAQRERVTLKEKVDDKLLFEAFFTAADESVGKDDATMQREASELLAKFIEP